MKIVPSFKNPAASGIFPLSVMMPAYNEVDTVGTIRRVRI
jgi:hypothetical protein